jgi:hypothetical protein
MKRRSTLLIQLFQQALAFRRDREADLQATIQLRELELYGLRTELARVRKMNQRQTLIHYLAATDEQLERMSRANAWYLQELEETFVEACVSGKIEESEFVKGAAA